MAHGGDKKIELRKIDWKAQSKVGSLENSHHVPTGGDTKILMEEVKWDAGSRIGSQENAQHTLGGGTAKIESHKLDFKERASSELDRYKSLHFKETAYAKSKYKTASLFLMAQWNPPQAVWYHLVLS